MSLIAARLPTPAVKTLAGDTGIRSFVLRQGRLTRGQRRALAEQWPVFGLESGAGLINLAQVFGNDHPVTFEIGFGMGQSLITQAQAQAERNFIGVEVHRPGVGHLLVQATELAASNIRVYAEDGQLVLKQCIPDASLDVIQIFFPDPWQKQRHHKRRLVNAPFLQLAWRKLKPGGVLHLATDWQDYADEMADEMAEVMAKKTAEGMTSCGREVQTFTSIPPPPRPETKFEARGRKLGHVISDLAYRANK